jgi:heme exporter protein D
MIEGGWNFVWAAYAIALGGLGLLTLVVLARLRSWSRRARELDRSK